MRLTLVLLATLALAGCGTVARSGALATDCTEWGVITPTAAEIASLTLTTKKQILKNNENRERECGVKPPAQ